MRLSHPRLALTWNGPGDARVREAAGQDGLALSWPRARSPRVSLARIATVLIPCALLSLVLCDLPGFLISSDSLFPAEFIWAFTHHHDAWSGLQHPRIPSFFPDLLVYGIAQIATGSWRVAMAAWVFVSLLWMVLIMSWITARVARSGGPSATLAVVLPLLLAMSAAALGLPRFVAVTGVEDAFFPWLLILVPYTHGGPFLLALSVAALASEAPRRPTAMRVASLAVLSFAVAVSDQLCLISLLGPLMAALLAATLMRTVERATALRVMAAVWCGAAFGFATAALALDRQAMPLPSPAGMLANVGGFLSGLEHDATRAIVLSGLVLALLLGCWRRGWHGWLGDFWPVFAAVSASGSLALTVMLYSDIWSFRYAMPALWWGFMFAAAALAEALSRCRRALSWRSAAAIVAGLALVWPVGGPLLGGLLTAEPKEVGTHSPRLFDADAALASCLERAGLRAGLGDYFAARAASAASDWALQIDPIDGLGEARVWGNNRLWFAHDIHDGSRRPPYRFIIMDRLSPEPIAAVYGQPDRIIRCGASTVWSYDGADDFYRNLERASPALADVFAAAPPR